MQEVYRLKYFMFGFDAEHPETCARLLKRKGIDAVVVGNADERVRLALSDCGLELYLCYGAHGLGDDFDHPAHLAKTACGREARWFSSGCPNDEALAEARLASALQRAVQTPGVRGILVDGARFASFASTEGTAGFFSCFCPRCVKRMEAMNIDAERIRAAVKWLHDVRKISDRTALREWFQFRAACVSAYFEHFVRRVHELPGGLSAGAFVFAPSLAGFVGQTAQACAPLDIVSPMLYRAYPHEDGPACLGHEWAAAAELFEPAVLRELAELSGIEAHPNLVPEEKPVHLRTRGFSPERIALEVASMKKRLSAGQKLMPILQIEDDRMSESAMAALNAGADGYGYFMYGQAPLNDLQRPVIE